MAIPRTQFELTNLILKTDADVFNISATDKSILAHMSVYFNRHSDKDFPDYLICWPSQERVASCVGVSRKTVNLTLAKCEQSGIIKSVGRGRTSKKYIWVWDFKDMQNNVVDKPKQVVHDPMYEDWDDDPPPF